MFRVGHFHARRSASSPTATIRPTTARATSPCLTTWVAWCGIQEWNEGILPAPWVDDGLEVNGTHYFGGHIQMSYAAYAIGGPRAAANPTDFDFILSRSPDAYYVDNNSRPVLGGQFVASYVSGK